MRGTPLFYSRSIRSVLFLIIILHITYDIRGVLGKICELIAKEGGDICNMMVIPTDVMDLAEIFLRVEAPDFERVVRALERHGYDVLVLIKMFNYCS